MDTTSENESVEKASVAILQAERSTQETLKGKLPPEERYFNNRLRVNYPGAKAWLTTAGKLIVELPLAVFLLTSYAPAAAGPATPDTDGQSNQATTTEVPPTASPTETKEPITYHIGTGGGGYTDAQASLNDSLSAKDQQTRIHRWLDYWINFENRPFPPDTKELSFKYIYNDPGKPTEVLVLIEGGGGLGGKLYAPPIGNGVFIDYPPAVEGDSIPENFSPLELTSGAEGQWLSIENGITVRRDDSGKVVERLNMATGKWEAAKPGMEVEFCTPDNFLDPKHEIDPESHFDGTLLKAVLKKLKESEPLFDPAKLKLTVPMDLWSFYNGAILDTTKIFYSLKAPLHGAPNFPIEGTQPFRIFLIGYTEFQGHIYAELVNVYYNKKDPGQYAVVFTPYRFDDYDKTDSGKIATMKFREEHMKVPVIITTNKVPRTQLPDPLVARTFAVPDLQDRIKRFVNGDLAALHGLTFLTETESFKNYPNYYK